MGTKYTHLGFQYYSEKEVESDGCNAKIWHWISDPDGREIAFPYSPYSYPTQDEVESFIEKLIEEKQMANHVNSYISFENLSEKAEKFLQELMPDYQTSSDEVINKIFDLSTDTEYDWDWHIENIGAKWITFEDVSACGMSTVTAWSAPEAFYRGLYKKLVSLDSPDAELWASYDDEMPNFVGVFGLAPNDYDYEEYVDEEVYQQCIGALPYLEDEDGEWEHNEEWWDKFDEWREKEYSYFKDGYQEYLEEMNEEDKC